MSYLEGHLPADDLELHRFQLLQDEFGSDRLAIAAFSCDAARRCKDVLDREALDLVRTLTAVFREAPGVSEVASLTTAGVLVGDGPTLRIQRVFPSDSPETLEKFRGLIRRDLMLPGTLVSPDLQTTALVIRFDPTLPDADRNQSVLELMEQAHAVSSSFGFSLYMTGDVVFGAVSDRYVTRDLSTLTPVMVLLIVVLLAWVFRGSFATVLALAAVSLPALWAFGLMGWFDRPLTPVVTTLPVLILVVGLTDAIHFLVRAHDLNAAFPDRRHLVAAVADEVGPPTTVTAVTGALGFLSFLAGPLPALRDFGVFAAIGIVGAWFTTFTLVPIAIGVWHLRLPTVRPPAFVLGDRFLGVVHRAAHGNALTVVVIAVVLASAAMAGISRIVVETDGFKLVGEGDPLSVSDEFVRERLRGAGSLELIFQPSGSETLLEPSTLSRLSDAEKLFSDRPGFGPPISLLTILRTANRELVGDDELPRSRSSAAQLVLLAEAADSQRIRRLATADYKLGRMSVSSRLGEIGRVSQSIEELRGDLSVLLDGYGTWYLTGALLLSLHQASLVLESQISSFSSAFLTIFLVLMWFLRSVRLGSLGMIPNVLPVIGILGVMGFASINLDVGTAMIASIVLGVSVDDTVYFLLHYSRARRRGADVRDATSYTLAVAGKPALFSASILALGFFVLALSSFQSLAFFGLLSGVAVLGAVATELVLLPALLELIVGRQKP